jgi:hypothetical protein
VIGFELVALSIGLALAITCKSPESARIGEALAPVTAADNVGGQAGAQAVQPEPEPTPKAEPEPAPAAQLVDRLFDLARDWNYDGPVARIERALEVRLSGDESRWSGTSTRWPLTVAFHPKRADRRASLHTSFTTVTSTDLAEMTRRFGAPVAQVKDKESRVEFDGPAGVRIVAGLLGGMSPTSPVAWIRLEGPGPRPPPPKDLF